MSAQPAPQAPPPEPVLEGRGLVRKFGDNVAVNGLSLAVHPGELYGLVGPDGAGKTTTIRMLTGLMVVDGGEARVLGQSTDSGNLVREAIGYMPQQYSLYGDLSINENLRFFARLFGLARRDYDERRERLLRITRLERFGDRRADALSGGMYKKLALACALLHRPQVLVLDEPTNGVDPVSRRELWDLLYEFVADGMAVLLATPYMDEAERCHRVGLIHQGALLTEGEPAELTARFPHQAFLVGGLDRQALEEAVEARPEVLALTPHGASLRLVVRQGDETRFHDWLATEALAESVTPVKPDFEDVFLGLLATSTGSGTGEPEETA
ncbi:MAG: ABC transporter ATP-binding protein [bacterium]